MGAKPSKRPTTYRQVLPPLPSPSFMPQDPRRSSVSAARYARIDDSFTNLEQVTKALANAGLESSNLIVGVDFTKSNEWTGAKSFNKRCLHHIGDCLNPYEQAINIIGRTLASFDEDSLIPCYGFGDSTTHDKDVFSFYPEDRPCNGFEEALVRYRELVPQLRLAGPTSFAPIIDMATGIVERSGGQYHVLLIIADGQVTRSVDTDRGQLSPQERDTINAIVKASEYPLSIVVVGVGDGPWGMMRQFDDNIPARAFDNFQFVNFTEIMLRNTASHSKEAEFALAALMEIPMQYKATLELQLLGQRKGTCSGRSCLPPPSRNANMNFHRNFSRSSSVRHVPTLDQQASAPPEYVSNMKQACPVCFLNPKNLAFGCGHQACHNCGKDIPICPTCHNIVTTRIRLFD